MSMFLFAFLCQNTYQNMCTIKCLWISRYSSQKRYQSKHISYTNLLFFDAQMKRKTLHIGLIQTLHSFLVPKRPRSRHSEATPVVAFQSEPLTGLVFHLPSPIVSSTAVSGSAIKQPVEKRTCMIEISWKMFGISYQQKIVEFTRYPKRLHQSLQMLESGVSENGANAAKAPFPMEYPQWSL